MNTNLTDLEIKQGYLDGESRAYDIIVRWIHEVVRARAWEERISPNDIVSDATYKLLINLREDKFEGRSSLKTYVQKITKYTIIDHARISKKLRPLQEDSQLTPINGDDIFEKEENEYILQRVLKLIGEKCRDLWKMIFFEELPYKKIAEINHISEENVKIRAHRCMKKAREIKDRIVRNL